MILSTLHLFAQTKQAVKQQIGTHFAFQTKFFATRTGFSHLRCPPNPCPFATPSLLYPHPTPLGWTHHPYPIPTPSLPYPHPTPLRCPPHPFSIPTPSLPYPNPTPTPSPPIPHPSPHHPQCGGAACKLELCRRSVACARRDDSRAADALRIRQSIDRQHALGSMHACALATIEYLLPTT